MRFCGKQVFFGETGTIFVFPLRSYMLACVQLGFVEMPCVQHLSLPNRTQKDCWVSSVIVSNQYPASNVICSRGSPVISSRV